MKKVTAFLSVLSLMLVTFGMVAVSAAIYDTASKQTIDEFFFQPANLSSLRIETPVALDDLSDDKIRELLMDKFITEYFYVIPDTANAEARKKGEIGLRFLTDDPAFKQWADTVAYEIASLAAQGVLRMARLVEMELPQESENWWTLKYELTTWNKPNDLSSAPEITQGTMYVNLRYQPGIRPTKNYKTFDLAEFLEEGGDPSEIFMFRIKQVE